MPGSIKGIATGTIRIFIEGEGFVKYKYTYTPPSNKAGGKLTDSPNLDQTAAAIVNLYKKTLHEKKPETMTAYITLKEPPSSEEASSEPSSNSSPEIDKITIKKGSETIALSLDTMVTRADNSETTVREVFQDFIRAYYSPSVRTVTKKSTEKKTPDPIVPHHQHLLIPK